MTNELITATNIVSREITGLDVVNSVNGFYSGAFDKLFGMVLALIALFGVILPILIQIYQKRVMKVSEAELKAEMARLLSEKKTELLTELEKKFSTEKEAINASLKENVTTIEKRLNKAEGGLFVLQASRETNFFEKCHDLCKAAELFGESDEGTDFCRMIESLTNNILPNLNKEDLEKEGLDRRLNNLLAETKKWNHKGLIYDLSTNFGNAIYATKNRSRIKPK